MTALLNLYLKIKILCSRDDAPLLLPDWYWRARIRDAARKEKHGK